uniref:Uncharacterized protein n=1 Tax=Acrobeloides nanus TaxID=290746 RepID=A0A914C3R1_9BILA
MSLKGKVAVVTGASRGIGRGIALQLGEAGAQVYITGRDPKNKKSDPTLPSLEKTAQVYAARLFVKNNHGGLIVNVSSFGGGGYYLNVAYGVGKAAVDRLTADTAHELKPHKVTVVSLWPGIVKTELIQKSVDAGVIFGGKIKDEFTKIYEASETTEYSGKAVVALAKDPNVLEKTGKILITADLGKEYGFKDIDGREIIIDPKEWAKIF